MSVSWLTRHVLSLGVLVFALAIVGTVFTFARPEYRPTSYTTTVDMAHQDHTRSRRSSRPLTHTPFRSR